MKAIVIIESYVLTVEIGNVEFGCSVKGLFEGRNRLIWEDF